MNRIKEINFADAIAIVEPGVITGDLQAKVRAQKLFYPPDPASLKDCSIGGNVATNAGGPRCLKYGVTRNYVIGLEVVLANGEVLRTGGRVHKNKTGFDLIGLFVGSEGMLGVVTEITVRVAAVAAGARDVVGCVRSTMSKRPRRCRKFSRPDFCRRRSRSRITSRWKPRGAILRRGDVPPGNAHLLVEVDGQPETVRSRNGETARAGRERESRTALRRATNGRGLRTALGVAARIQQFAAGHWPNETERGHCRAAESPRRSDRIRRSAFEEVTAFRSPASVMRATATFTSTSWPTATIATPRCARKWSARSMNFSRKCSRGAE